MKLKSIFLHTILGLSALAALAFFVPETATLENSLPIKEAKAEEACPASIPESYSTIRTGSANGPIIASYTNYGWNAESGVANPSYETLSVPLGTVLYYSNSTSGITGPNRSIGSTHSAPGGATVTSPGDKAGYYPSGYYFTRQTFVSGYTSPVTASGTFLFVGGYYSCWGGFDDGITELFIQVVAQGEPVPTTKTFNSTLAIVKDPSVALLVNGQSSAVIASGDSASLSWTTNSVNQGNSCTAANNNIISGNPDPLWVGPKLGQTPFTPPSPAPPSGGSQSVGPFTTPGTFQYTIQCGGLNNVQSAPSTVTITVGSNPAYTCLATPDTQSVNAGTNGSALIDVTALNGYSSPVTFISAITPSVDSPPTISLSGNPQSSPYSTPTVATIQTSPGTTAGTYQIIFTGTGNVACPPITFQVTSPMVSSEIYCDTNSEGPCEVILGGATPIRWDARNVDECTVTKSTVSNPTPVFWASGFPVTQSSGPLNENTTFYLNCTGPNGSPPPDSVVVNVTSTITPPTVDLKCAVNAESSTSNGPCIVADGETGNLSWTSTNATSCTIDNGIGSVPINSGPSGVTTSPITRSVTYLITCTGPGSPPDAVDSVEFDIDVLPPGGNSFNLDCTPSLIVLDQGNQDSYRLITTKIGNFNSPVHFTVKTVSPRTAQMPDIAIVESTNDRIPSNETLSSVNTSPSTTVGNYAIVFEGAGGGITKTCTVGLEVKSNGSISPNPPTVSADNSQCGKITINWVPSTTGVTPTGFRVFRGDSANPNTGNWTDISNLLGPSVRSYVDNSPGSSNNYYKVIAYNGSSASASSSSVLANAIPCVPIINASDKDVKSVIGLTTKDFKPKACNGVSDIASLSNNAVFAVGDKITFKINVCNDGFGSMTGVTVVDTMKNLSKPTFNSLSSCVTGHNYVPGSDTITFNLAPIAPGNVTRQVCSIEFTAEVTAPAVTTAALYRFQNIGKIRTNELPEYPVFTPLYPFSVSGGVPDRVETAPQ